MPDIALQDHKRIFSAFCSKDEKAAIRAINDSLEIWKRNL